MTIYLIVLLRFVMWRVSGDFVTLQPMPSIELSFNEIPNAFCVALPIQHVVDTEGAGDCFTATFINAVAERGLTLSGIPAAIREAMENASRSVGYFGSKGFIREGSKRNCRD